MKQIKYITIVILTVGIISSFPSCSGFLDELNHSSQPAEEYYKTKGGFESLVIGCYYDLRKIYNLKDYMKFSQQGTDIFTQNYPTEVTVMNQYTTNYQSDNGSVYVMWERWYGGLKNVNAALDRSKEVILIKDDPDGMEEHVLEQRIAEMKVLRALYLFEIVRNWGQGPLMVTEPLEPVYTTGYSSGQEFYTQIFKDLEDAIAILPARQTGDNYGRTSWSVAKHLRAMAYLTRGYETYGNSNDFENAFKDAEDVYLNSGHSLQSDYQMVHRQSNETNSEIIFCVGFANTSNYNDNMWNQWYTFPYTTGGWLGLGKDASYGNASLYVDAIPTKFAYLMYDWQKDRRASVNYMSPLNGESGTSVDGRTLGKNWFHCTTPVDNTFAVGDTVVYFPVPTDRNFKVWSEAEKNQVKYKVFNYPSGDPTDMSNDDYYKPAYQNTHATSRTFLPIWKFKDANAIYKEDESGSGTRDIYLFRLAETCLIAAEAAVMNNDNENALKYINYVVSRASVNAPESGLSLYSGTVTLDDILDERARELLAEVPRWNDLQRTGKLAERVLKYNWDTNNITGGVIQTTLSEQSFKDKFRYRPIPLKWLNSLSNGHELGNNPGW